MAFCLASLIHFFPLGELDLKKTKETTVTELENHTTSSEGTGNGSQASVLVCYLLPFP